MIYILLDIDGVVSPLYSIPVEEQHEIVPRSQYTTWPIRISVVNAITEWKSRDDVTVVWASSHHEDSNEIFSALGLPDSEWINFSDWTNEKLNNIVEFIESRSIEDRFVWVEDENSDIYQSWIESSPRDILFITPDGRTGLNDHDIEKINAFIEGDQNYDYHNDLQDQGKDVMTVEDNHKDSTTQSTAVGVAALFERAERVYNEHVQDGLNKKSEIIQDAENQRLRIIEEANNEASEILTKAKEEAENAIDLAQQEIDSKIENFKEQEQTYQSRIAMIMDFEKKYRNELMNVVAVNDSIVETIDESLLAVKNASKEIYRYLDMDEIFEERDGELIVHAHISSLPDEDGSSESSIDNDSTEETDAAPVDVEESSDADTEDSTVQEVEINDADDDSDHIADIDGIEETQEELRARESNNH